MADKFFPTKKRDGDLSWTEGGADLRDLAAFHALTGILAAPAGKRCTPYEVANLSYVMADAMMERRKK